MNIYYIFVTYLFLTIILPTTHTQTSSYLNKNEKAKELIPEFGKHKVLHFACEYKTAADLISKQT